MATLTELQYTSDWLKGEVQSPNKFTRDQIVVSNPGGAAVTYPGGLVLAKSGSNYVILAPAASDGTQNAVALLGATVTIAAGGLPVARPFPQTSISPTLPAPPPTRKRQL
jgi:hypothetical protein